MGDGLEGVAGASSGIKASKEAVTSVEERTWWPEQGGGDGRARRILSWHLGGGVAEFGGCVMCADDAGCSCNSNVSGTRFPEVENAGRQADWKYWGRGADNKFLLEDIEFETLGDSQVDTPRRQLGILLGTESGINWDFPTSALVTSEARSLCVVGVTLCSGWVPNL